MRIENSSARDWGTELLRYVYSAILTCVALLTCHLLRPYTGDTLPYILLPAAVAFSAWYFGAGAAVLNAILTLAAVDYWFLAPVHFFVIPSLGQGICMVAFLLVSGALIAMGETRRRQNEWLRKGHTELEDRVQERTAELDSANNGLRELSARLMQLQDDERRRIARELHDSVGQLLVALNMNLASARLDIERLAKTASALADSEALVQEMSKEVRTISHLLHPPLLDEAGLESAVRWYVDGFAQRSKIKVDLHLPERFGRLSRELETAIFRVVQECLTNIHRHSGSAVARIRLDQAEGQVLLTIEDHGKGIPAHKQIELSTSGAPGVGIRGMRERLRQLGGQLEIVSKTTGTLVVAKLPAGEPLEVEAPEIVDTSSRATA